MKIFGVGDSFAEQNNRIRQLLGEGTGGRKLVSATGQTPHWRDLAKQTITDIAIGQKDSSKSYAYLAKFKDSLDNRQVQKPVAGAFNQLSKKRTKSEAPREKSSLLTEPSFSKVDITTKQLMFEKRRFSGSRPQNVSRALTSDRPNHPSSFQGYEIKKSRVQDLLGSFEKSKKLNYSNSQFAVRRENPSSLKKTSSSKNKRLDREPSADKFERLFFTPASVKRPQTTKDRLMSSMERNDITKEKTNLKAKNYLTPRAKLVFNNKATDFSRASNRRLQNLSFAGKAGASSASRFDSFIDLRRDILHTQPTETSRYNKLKLSDPRAEYTKRFLHNALSRGSPSVQANIVTQEKSPILGDWFSGSKHK